MRKLVIALVVAALAAALISGRAQAFGYYSVQEGDSLWDIARRFGVTVEALAEVNGIHNPSVILPGQVLRLSLPKEGIVYSIATWYGEAFHGNPMANGEIYDMHDPTTCASNWWPLGTWLQVRYEGRVIAVKVTDRGAFKHAVDLSYAAFKYLANPSLGVIPVEISVLGT